MHKTYTYLALGDSYTIGESVLLSESFPYQTVQLLRKQGYSVMAPEIIAKTGWTTEELQQGMAGYVFSPKYDFVTLLIGVNNQYRGQEIIIYKQQFETLLQRTLELAGGKKEHVIVLSIPDYGRTPFAKEKSPQKTTKEIENYNKLAKAICIQYKVPFLPLDNYEDSTQKIKPSLLANDGLHPSPKAYAKWAKLLASVMEKVLKK